MKLICSFCRHHHFHYRYALAFIIPAALRHANYNTTTSFSCARGENTNYSSFSSPRDIDIYSSNMKISSLGRHGQVKEARKLFDEMPKRDGVTFAAMITVYLKNNDFSKAEKIFRTMPFRNIVAESAMVHGHLKAGNVSEARRVFDNMVERNVFAWTSLISGYFEIGQVVEACWLFDQMPEKNVVSWTTMVLGYARNGLIDEAQKTFDRMPVKNIVSWTAMLKSYVENGRFKEALNLFHEMPMRNMYSWNIMISACFSCGRIDQAVQLFSSMPQKNAVSWTSMVTGLAQNKMTMKAREYFDQMPHRDIAAWNAMISAYVDECLMVEAVELFNSMSDRNIITWNSMIDGYARSGPDGEALNLLVLMLRSCFMPNETTFTSVLTSCGSLMELMQVHALAILSGCEGETSLCNALITMYSRNGDLSAARLAFKCTKVKDVVSWTAIILAYSNHGFGQCSLQSFGCMLRSGIKPDGITFVGVLTACSHAGLVTKGQKLFRSMSSFYGIEHRGEHYSCLVHILGHAGQVDDAMRVVAEVPPSEQDGAVLGALLSACRFNGNEELASFVGEKLLEMDPASSGGYVLLSNIHAAQGKWEEFAQVRKKMKDENVNKVPGISQIEVNGKNHTFYAGDRSHREAPNIYRFLKQTLFPIMQKKAGKESYSSGLFSFEETYDKCFNFV